jgi:hypothetical protein
VHYGVCFNVCSLIFIAPLLWMTNTQYYTDTQGSIMDFVSVLVPKYFDHPCLGRPIHGFMLHPHRIDNRLYDLVRYGVCSLVISPLPGSIHRIYTGLYPHSTQGREFALRWGGFRVWFIVEFSERGDPTFNVKSAE